MTFDMIIGIIVLSASLTGVVILTLWSRHIIERIFSNSPDKLKENSETNH